MDKTIEELLEASSLGTPEAKAARAQTPNSVLQEIMERVTGLELVPKVWRDQILYAREIPGRGLCGLERYIYSCGLLTELCFDGMSYDYTERYCYPSTTEARRALAVWDGNGDPPGEWIKEKVSGRLRPKPM